MDISVPNINHKTFDIHRVAWIVLTGAFIGFCALCLTTSFGVYYFLYQSSVQMNAQVRVARGTVGLVSADFSERFEFDEEQIAREDTVLTDTLSQSVVTLRNLEGDVVASVTLKNDSELKIIRMTQPRFEWGQLGYEIVLQGARGQFDVFIPDKFQDNVKLTFLLPHETMANIGQAGRYKLSIAEENIQLETLRGQAAILLSERQRSRSVGAGEIGVYQVVQNDLFVNPAYEELIANNIFVQPIVDTDAIEAGNVKTFDLWNCVDRTNNDNPDRGNWRIPGELEWQIFEGRLALHIYRGGGANTHGETGCIQPLGTSAVSGRNVQEYDYLALHATFFIANHSLNACGIAGSECPIMMLIDYIDTDGDRNKWLQGFYSKNTPSSDYPLRCNSAGCEEHKAINDGAWYTYESGNLFTLLPTDRQPTSILNVQFYASGHEYDVYISELSLLASPPNTGNGEET